MTLYDIIMLALLLGTVFFGYWKGLAWQVASVAAIVVSYFAAYRFRDQVAQYVQAEPPFNRIAAMLIIFVASSLIIWLAYAYVTRSLEKAELNGFNRQMGALVGAVLGILLCMVVTMFSVSLLGQDAHDSIHHSKFGPYVLRGISTVHMVVPEELSASLDPHFDKFYQQLGYDQNRPINSYPAYQGTNGIPNAVPGGSQYPAGQPLFNPNSGQQASYQGNWTASPAASPTPNSYSNGYQPSNSYQPPPTNNQTQTRYGFQPNASNQGTNYIPQPQQSQQQAPGLPPIQLKLDTETLLNGAGQFLKNQIQNPNGN